MFNYHKEKILKLINSIDDETRDLVYIQYPDLYKSYKKACQEESRARLISIKMKLLTVLNKE